MHDFFLRKISKLSIFVIMILCFSCDQNIQLDLDIKSVSHQGSKIEGAEVRVNGEFIGKTNESGRLKKKILAKIGQKLRLEVSKEDKENFYAPFVKTVEAQDYLSIDFRVDAVLYHIPKQDNSETDKKNTVSEIDQFESNQNDKSTVPLNEDELSEFENAIAEPANEEIPAVSKNKPNLSEHDLNKYLAKKQGLDPQGKKQLISKEQTLKKSIFEDLSYPKRDVLIPPKALVKKDNKIKYTVSVIDKKGPIADAIVHLGNRDLLELRFVCKTNAKGNCTFKIPDQQISNRSLFIKKAGYKSATKKMRTNLGNKMVVKLDSGITIDIYAITKHFNFTKGLKNVSVLADGKLVGITNEFGHFSYNFNGKKDDLIEITLRSSNLHPSEYSTDFIVSEKLSLIKYFTPVEPPISRIAMMNAISGNENSSLQTEGLVQSLRRSIRNHPLLSIVGSEVISNLAKRRGENITGLLRSGWSKSSLKSNLDAVLQVTVNAVGNLEVVAVDSNGKQIAGSIIDLEAIDNTGIKQASEKVVEELVSNFPFEGSVIKFENKIATVNWNKKHQLSLKSGDSVFIYGSQVNKKGTRISYKKIAEGKVRKVLDQFVKISIFNLSPRSIISKGDLAVLKRKIPAREKIANTHSKRLAVNTLPTILVSNQNGKAIVGASIYIEGKWQGSTNQNGKLKLEESFRGKKSTVIVSKYGYAAKKLQVKIGSALRVRLPRENATIRITSNPSNAKVFLDERKIGSTPMLNSIPIKRGFSKLKLVVGYPYKDFEQILDVSSENIDFTGARRIEFEKDYIRMALTQIEQNKLSTAKSLLQKISKSHSSYLQSRHLLGEIALNQLGEIDDAIKYFSEVVQEKTVSNFSNKRFLPSHINLALSHFKKGAIPKYSNTDRIKSLVKAASIFDQVKKQLRFLDKKTYDRSVHEIYYYSALAKYRAYEIGKSTVLLEDSIRDWQNYLDSIVPLVAYEGSEYFRENSHIYLKQARSHFRANKNSQRL